MPTWPDEPANMILDDGGDATMMVLRGAQYEKAGVVPPAFHWNSMQPSPAWGDRWLMMNLSPSYQPRLSRLASSKPSVNRTAEARPEACCSSGRPAAQGDNIPPKTTPTRQMSGRLTEKSVMESTFA